jgi:hypothetical protein
VRHTGPSTLVSTPFLCAFLSSLVLNYFNMQTNTFAPKNAGSSFSPTANMPQSKSECISNRFTDDLPVRCVFLNTCV